MVVKTNGTQKDAKVVNIVPQAKDPSRVMHYTVEYDSTKPEETLRNFVADVKTMLARYTGNNDRLQQIEQEIIDLEHYMEISSYKTVPNGYKLYRKLAELRRERRACKNENDLLQPIWEFFHATEVLKKLSWVQGECSTARSAIDARVYSIRTDVLDSFLEPDKDVDAQQIVDLGSDKLAESLAIP